MLLVFRQVQEDSFNKTWNLYTSFSTRLMSKVVKNASVLWAYLRGFFQHDLCQIVKISAICVKLSKFLLFFRKVQENIMNMTCVKGYQKCYWSLGKSNRTFSTWPMSNVIKKSNCSLDKSRRSFSTCYFIMVIKYSRMFVQKRPQWL